MKVTLPQLVCLLISLAAFGQQPQFAVSTEAAMMTTRYTYHDPAGRLFPITRETRVRWGLTGRWYASPRLTTEAGFVFFQTPAPSIDYVFYRPNPSALFRDKPGPRTQFVVRQYYDLITDLQPNGRRSMAFGPHVGLGLTTYNTTMGGSFGNQQTGYTTAGLEERIGSKASSYHPNRTTTSVEAGLNLHLYKRRWHTRLHYTWQWGLNRTLQSDVEYRSSLDDKLNRATISTTNSGVAYGLSVGYMFGEEQQKGVPAFWKRE